uniref:C-type lectin domain-containing protein n=1 Tax=Felis catus TaxID=9685 RepID=A0ABI7YZB4_FELCA
MPRAALPALLLPLLGLAAAAVADCPSSTWVQFQDSCYIFLQEAIKVESIEDVRNQCTDHGADMVSIHNEEENAFILETLKKQWKGPDDILLGMFFDTDDASFKWFDKSNMTFDKWTDQEDGEDLVDTCAFLHTKTGEWKKGNCEISSVEGTLCKAAIPYEKKYLSDSRYRQRILFRISLYGYKPAPDPYWLVSKHYSAAVNESTCTNTLFKD